MVQQWKSSMVTWHTHFRSLVSIHTKPKKISCFWPQSNSVCVAWMQTKLLYCHKIRSCGTSWIKGWASLKIILDVVIKKFSNARNRTPATQFLSRNKEQCTGQAGCFINITKNLNLKEWCMDIYTRHLPTRSTVECQCSRISCLGFWPFVITHFNP